MQLLWIALFWLGLGVFDAMQTVLVMHSEGMHHVWLKLFLVTVATWLPWALATPGVFWLGRKFPPLGRRAYMRWLPHVAACIAIGFVFAGWTTILHAIFNPYDGPGSAHYVEAGLDKFANGMLSSFVLYAGILTVKYGSDSRARLAISQMEAARLNEGLSKAQLSALRSQIEPHFLFNTLNAVSGLIREGRNDAAVATVAALSDFLRRMLEDTNRQEVPLHEEMAFVRDYLHIAKMRFAERLDLRIDVPSELDVATVPNLILQPLVENAIKHGIAKRAQGGRIGIGASSHRGMLTLIVTNDGPSLPAALETPSLGIGVANVRARLRGLYGDASSLTMRNGSAGGVEVSIVLPLRAAVALA